MHVPGVQLIVMELAPAVPVHVCGPLTDSFPSASTVPVNPLKGAAKESVQFVCVTTAFCPTSEGSQCAVTFHVPATLGHPELPLEDDEELELELHAHAKSATNAATRTLVIPPS